MLATISEVIIVVLFIFAFYVIGFFVLLNKCYKKVDQGQALVRTGMGGTFVSFTGKFVIPMIHKVEYLDITLKRIVIEKLGQEALTCKDGTQADIKAAFFIRVNPRIEDVLKVVSKLGISQAADMAVLKEIFNERFTQALKTVCNQKDFETLTNRELFKNKVAEAIGKDLDGFMLDVVTIDYLEKNKP